MQRAIYCIMFSLTIVALWGCSGRAERPLANPTHSLLVAQISGDDTPTDSTHLVNYNFINGDLSSIDTIVISKLFNDIASFESIYKDRYLINIQGQVIDLKTQKIIKEETDDFIMARGDTLIFDGNAYCDEECYTELNLKTKKYQVVDNDFFILKDDLHSPNYKYSISSNNRKGYFGNEIILKHRNQEESVIVEDAGLGTPLKNVSAYEQAVPLYWFDSETFLFAYFFSFAQIRMVNIIDGSNQVITRIDSIPSSTLNAYFYEDSTGEIVFSCEKGKYRIDLKESKHEKYQRIKLQHDFSQEAEPDSLGAEIFYLNESLGKLWHRRPKTIENHIAVEYGETGSNLGYPAGIKVWNATSKDWTTINIPALFEVVGWYNKENQ